MLNGKEIVKRGIVTGPIEEENISQHGVDLNLIKVQRLGGKPGRVSVKQKTILCDYEDVPVLGGVWALDTGVYNVEFAQGCKIPEDVMLLIRQRSSVLRNGGIIHSSVFDAGFETDSIGTIMILHNPLTIEFNARIAQIYNHSCTPVQNLYDGQWQGDNQRDTDEE